MCSTQWERGLAVLQEYQKRLAIIDEEITALREVDIEVFTADDCDELIATLETLRNHSLALQYPLIALTMGTSGRLNGADHLVAAARSTRTDARLRIARAELLTPRTSLTGDRLEPPFPQLSAAVDDGAANTAHLSVIEEFRRHLLPVIGQIDPDTGEPVLVQEHLDAAIDELGRLTRTLTPDNLRLAANRLVERLLPGGTLDKDAERKAHFTLGRQRPDGLSSFRGLASAELRAYLEPLIAGFSAPGVANPADEVPRTEPADGRWDGPTSGPVWNNPDDPDAEPRETPESRDARRTAAQRDDRHAGRRRHDALQLALRTALMSQQLGTHRGLPVSVIITMTLQQLENATGYVRTGGGTRLTIADALKLATHSHHYLAVFDQHTRIPLYLGRTRRTANIGQRLVLHALDRGCSYPECEATGYFCETHHRTADWADGGLTDITDLTFACPTHHRLHGTEPDQYRTSAAPPDHDHPGRTLWHHNTTDPFMTDGEINHAHHPDELLDS